MAGLPPTSPVRVPRVLQVPPPLRPRSRLMDPQPNPAPRHPRCRRNLNLEFFSAPK